MPGGFVPVEDQGYIMVNAQLPNGASLERTEEVMDEVNEMMLSLPHIRNVATVGGYSILSGIKGPNYGFSFVTFVPWDERPLIFGLAFVFSFLFLAAQYESWALPLGVMLTVPIAMLGAASLSLAVRG